MLLRAGLAAALKWASDSGRLEKVPSPAGGSLDLTGLHIIQYDTI